MIVGVVYGLWFLFFGSGWWALTEIKINNQSPLTEDDLQAVASDYLGERLFFVNRRDNLWLIDKPELTKRFLIKFPVLESVRVEKKYFYGLNLVFKARQARGIWCYSKLPDCLVFDNFGVGFEEFKNSTLPDNWLAIEDYQTPQPALGQKVASANYFGLLATVEKLTKQIGLLWSGLIIPAEPLRINLKTSEGWLAYFSLNSNLEEQFNNLRFFLTQQSPEERLVWQYVDLRVPGRVYYK